MTITAGVISLLVILAPLLVLWLRRRAAASDAPGVAMQRRREQVAHEIIKHDEAGANRRIDDELARLRNLQSGKQRQDHPQG